MKSKTSKRTKSPVSLNSRPGDTASVMAHLYPRREGTVESLLKTLTPEKQKCLNTQESVPAVVMCPLCRRTNVVTRVGEVPGVLGLTDHVYRCGYDDYAFVISVRDDKPRRF